MDDSIYSILRQEPVSRPVRNFLFKAGKAFDQLQWEITQKTLQLAAQSKQIEELKAKKQREWQLIVMKSCEY